MTEHDTDTDTGTELAVSNDAEAKLNTPVTEMPITYRTLQMLAGTTTVPRRYLESATPVQDMMAAVLYGREMNVGPMEAIQSFYLVNGTVSMSGKLMSALIHRAGHKIVVEFKQNKVVVHAHRRDPYTRELHEVGVVEFSRDDAEQAGLSGKDTYKSYPRIMWAWRAISWAARMFYADVISGIGYVPEEVDVDAPIEPIPVDEVDVVYGPDEQGAVENGTAMVVDEFGDDAEVVMEVDT